MIAINWSMLSALAASIGVIVALYFHKRNLDHAQLSNSARMVLDLVGNFDSGEMRKHRRNFSKALLTNPSSINLSGNSPVFEFFEEIGYMTRREVLDRGMVWNSFFFWLEPYYVAARSNPDLISAARSTEHRPALYKEIEWLFFTLLEVDKKENGYTKYHRRDWRRFLEEESKLVYEETATPIDSSRMEESLLDSDTTTKDKTSLPSASA
jgi:hypothetical protein